MNASEDIGNIKESDFYQGFFQIRPSSVFFASYTVVATPVIVGLLYFIIWFELNGSDSRRTFINRLVSPICWASIAYVAVPQTIDFLRFFLGPFSHRVCYFDLFMKSILVNVNMFFFSFITLSRYFSIFVMKNPLFYFDDFWCRFICLWVVLATFFIQFVSDFLPGKHPLNYFVCTGKNPLLDSNKETRNTRNYPMFVGCGMLVLVHIFVHVKIRLFKSNQVEPFSNIQGSTMDKKPMTDYFVVLSYILFIVVHILLLFKIQTLDMTKMDVYPNYIYLYYLHLWLLPNFGLMLTSIYFARNHQLRDAFFREVRSFMTRLRCVS